MKKQLLIIATAAGLFLTPFTGSALAASSTYTVQSGDTLWKIATANNISVQDLKTWNTLTSDSIYVNQTLTLVAPQTTYAVQSGDTLSAIAKKYGITVDSLKVTNSLSSDMIYVGQVLKIPTNTIQPPTPTVSKVNLLVTEAKKYIGTPYVWGGSTPSGFDCSGYVNYVFTKIGVSIPRTAATIWSATKPVASPAVGDLVFFTTYATGPSHLGIYLGNNQFIHASSSVGVTISDLTNSYWKARYLGAKTAF